MNEIELFFCFIPNKTIRGIKCQVVLGCNADNSKKILLLDILRVCCFKNITELPVFTGHLLTNRFC